MRDHRPHIGRGGRAVLAALVAALALLGAGGGAAPAQAATGGSLVGWLSPTAPFPNLTMALFPPSGKKATPTHVHVTEDGASTGPVAVTPVSQAPSGGFGLIVLVDQNSSMAGGPLSAAMQATRQLASLRKPGQALGLTTFGVTPRPVLRPTTDAAQITKALGQTPRTSRAANVPAAIIQAAGALTAAHVKLGAIVIISDGAGALIARGGPSPAAAQTAAQAARTPVITVGLRSGASTPASLAALRSYTPGSQFVSATPATLPKVMKQIYATVTRGYLVQWRSRQPAGHTVNVSLTMDGVPGAVDASYQVPAGTVSRPAAGAHPAAGDHRASPARARPARFPAFSLVHQLASMPPFLAAASATPATAHSSFWGSSTGVLAVAGIVGLLVIVALMPLFYRPSRAVRTRVGSFTPPSLADDSILLPGTAHPPRMGLLRFVEHGSWWPPFVEDVEIADFKSSPVSLVKRSFLMGLVVGVLAALITGTAVVALVPLIAWPYVLRRVVKRAAEKKRRLFRDVLPTYLQDLASAMRVGRSFVGGLDVISDGAEEPVKTELERVVTDEALGRPLDESLDRVAERMQAPDLEQVALIAALNRRSGSNVAEALDRVAEGARERADLRREIRALTAQGKMSSYVLTALPALLLLGINLISPKYAQPLFHTVVGIILVIVGAGMTFAGWKVMQKISTVKD